MRPIILLLITALLLTACTAVTPSPAPTVTAPPSATPTLTVTQALVWQTPTPASGDVLPPAAPTATPLPSPTLPPTPTPTPPPIPTLPPEQVGGLQGVPDPRVTAPGLFDLARSDAPIPQFVNAMRMGGIEVSGEEVFQNITFESRQYPILDDQGNIITDEQGKPVMKEYVLAVWNLPEELLPERFRDVAGPIPLMRAERDQNGEWHWYSPEAAGVVPLRTLADAINLRISLLASEAYFFDHKYFELFNTISNSFFNWSMIEKERGIFAPEKNYLNSVNQTAKRHHIAHIAGVDLI